jgi:predicted nucleic acid-binding protein
VKLVLDSSVAAKWLVPERDSDKARNLFEAWSDGQVDLIAPTLLIAEIASMLWKRAIRGIVPGAEALRLFRSFLELGLVLTPIKTVASAALRLSLARRHSLYDSLYVALAATEGCELMTADEKLFKAFEATFPKVRLLADWHPIP